MISSINPTLSTALSLWQSMPAPEAAGQSVASSSATKTVNPTSTINSASAAQTAIAQVFAILAAAQKQNGSSASAQSVISAYASETYATATASVNVTASTTITTPDLVTQINAAVSQVNALMKQSPANSDGAQVRDSDAVAVTTGSAPVSNQLGLKLGGPAPFDLANALSDLTNSTNAGVAAGAKDMLSRQVQTPEYPTGFEWMTNNRNVNLSSTSGTVAWSLTQFRDDMVLGLANSLLDGSATANSYAAGALSATHNGSFTLVNMHGSMDLENNPNANAQGGANVGWVFGGGTDNAATPSWAIVLPTDTVQTSVSVTASATSATKS